MARKKSNEALLEKENDKLRRDNDKLRRDVRKYKKQSLTLRERINDLEYHIRDVADEEIIEHLKDLRRNCPTQAETMEEIAADSGKYVWEPSPEEPEEIEVEKFDGNPQSATYGQTIRVMVPNPKRNPKKFNLMDRIR